jgi:CubicO group peptidase (beta-lactamase class C family)
MSELDLATVTRLVADAAGAAAGSSIPGYVVGVEQGGDQRIVARGTTIAGGGSPIDEHTIFRWCSITKTAMAAVVLELEDRGVVSLDEPIGRRWEFLGDPHLSELTPRILLTHMSGLEAELPEGLAEFGSGDDALARAVSEFGRLRQFAPPGAAWGYCNTGFWLLGRLIETLVGSTVERAVHELLLNPNGLASTFTSVGEIPSADLSRLALPHARDTDHATGLARTTEAVMPRARFASGGLLGSTADLLRFGRSQLQMTDRLDRVAQILVPTDSMSRSQGLGWIVERTPAGTMFDHSGFFVGYASQLIVVPAADLVVTMVGNGAAAWDIGEAVRAEIRRLLGAPGGDTPTDMADAEPGVYDYPEVDHISISGAGSRLEMHVVERDGRVESSALRPVPTGGQEVVAGEFSGCTIAALPADTAVIRLAERLGRRRDG